MNDISPIELVRYAADRLDDICSRVVFLGGAVVGLLITDKVSRIPRITNDVDVTIEIGSLIEFYALDQILLARGFKNDMTGPICRYMHGPVKLDIMPASPDVLGFTNRWYPLAIATARKHRFESGTTINLISAPCFLATKLEAFSAPNREGHNDVFTSRDFEDVIRVIDGHPSVTAEIIDAPSEIRDFVKVSISQILQANYVEDAIAGYVERGREDVVIARLTSIGSI